MVELKKETVKNVTALAKTKVVLNQAVADFLFFTPILNIQYFCSMMLIWFGMSLTIKG